MFLIYSWCDYGIGAILALTVTGDISAAWMLATVPLACIGGFLRGVDRARAKGRTP